MGQIYDEMNDGSLTMGKCRGEVEERQPIKETLEGIRKQLEETEAMLMIIIGGLRGDNDREPQVKDEVCCMADETRLIN